MTQDPTAQSIRVRLLNRAKELGIRFLPDTITGEEIREDGIYEGIRLQMKADLAGANLHLQVDLGFGDAVTPGTEEVTVPSQLDDLDEPQLPGYLPETAVVGARGTHLAADD